ncbi:MAG: cytochrome-c oxidase, cbb3-type subunit III [Novosphingobium sp.]|nr:cytochrome-c oxidase, cbb3-type subunit III [Novosphingobium sp.]
MANRRIDEPTGVETVGHEWDGIEELNNPLPRWWVITFWITVLFALGYIVVYPAIPLLGKGTEGLWGWSSRGQLAAEMTAAEAARKPVLDKIAATPLEQIAADQQLLAQARAGGAAAFKQNCALCHGSGGKGMVGYPNLADRDWLWGGSVTDIEFSITHGIRSPGAASTRTSLMPSFGKDGILQDGQIADTSAYVLSLSGKAPSDAVAQRGAAVFAANCAACHGADGKGLRQFGAPNLADQVWLYGGTKEQVAASIARVRAGVMPAWGSKLDPVTIKMLAIYVHSLGGGEQFAAAPAAAAPAPANGNGNAKP